MAQQYRLIIGNTEKKNYELDIDNFSFMIGDLQSDILLREFNHDKLNLLIKKTRYVKHTSKLDDEISEYPLNNMQTLFMCLNIYIYDNPILLTSYPNGVHTEGLLLIPSTAYKEMIDNESKETYETESKANVFFQSYLLQMLENIYQTPLLEKNNEFKTALQFESHENLMNEIKKVYKTEEQIQYMNSTKTSKDYIDNILSQTQLKNSNLELLINKVTYKNLEEKDLTPGKHNAENNYRLFLQLKEEGEKIIVSLQERGKEIEKEELEEELKKNWLSTIYKLSHQVDMNKIIFAADAFINFATTQIEMVPTKNKLGRLNPNSEIIANTVLELIAFHDLFNKEYLAELILTRTKSSKYRMPIEIITEEEAERREKLINLVTVENIIELKNMINVNSSISFSKNELFKKSLYTNNYEIIDILYQHSNKDNRFYKSIILEMLYSKYSNVGLCYLYDNYKWSKEDVKTFLRAFEKEDFTYVKKIINDHSIDIIENYSEMLRYSIDMNKAPWIIKESLDFYSEKIKEKYGDSFFSEMLEKSLIECMHTNEFEKINYLIHYGVVRGKEWNELCIQNEEKKENDNEQHLRISAAIKEVERLYSLIELKSSLQYNLNENQPTLEMKKKI